MEMPADRLRWFRLYSYKQQQPPACPQHRRQFPRLSPSGDASGWRLEPGFFVEGVRHCCPGNLLRSLQVGDRLELAPEPNRHPTGNPEDLTPEGLAPPYAVRVEYGIFQVGYVPCSASRLLYRLLQQGIGVLAQVGNLDLTAPLERALWIEACLLE